MEDCFEGITYCDYAQERLVAKPHEEMFEKAEREAGVDGVSECWFVDDSRLICREARERGWTIVHKIEEGDVLEEGEGGMVQVRELGELRGLFPRFFKKGEGGGDKEGANGTT